MYLKTRGIEPDDHDVTKELVSACEMWECDMGAGGDLSCEAFSRRSSLLIALILGWRHHP